MNNTERRPFGRRTGLRASIDRIPALAEGLRRLLLRDASGVRVGHSWTLWAPFLCKVRLSESDSQISDALSAAANVTDADFSNLILIPLKLLMCILQDLY